jgi:hypothetical protein
LHRSRGIHVSVAPIGRQKEDSKMSTPKEATAAIMHLLEEQPLVGAALAELGEDDLEELAELLGKVRSIVDGAAASSSDGADNLTWLEDKMRESSTPLTLKFGDDEFHITAGAATFSGASLTAVIKAMRW